MDERDAPTVHSRSEEYENQGGGPKSARAKMVSSNAQSGQSVVSGSDGVSGGAKVGMSAYDHPVCEPKADERGPLDSSTPIEANEEDLLAQIVRERDIRRARLESRRVGGNQTADDDELIQPSLSAATAPLKASTASKEVSFSTAPSGSGYSLRGSAPLSSVESWRHLPCIPLSPVVAASPAVQSQESHADRRGSMVGGLKGAVKV